MTEMFTEENYDKMIGELFVRFPSFQKVGAGAYKPGLERMEFFDSLAGHPQRKYRTIHVAGTNGKGSVSSMLASVLAAGGQKVGLYTSPHIRDFRERMRIVDSTAGSAGGKDAVQYITKEEVWDFISAWRDTFDHLEMSFFEITTAMAFSWFADRGVDVAVIETGLGGRLDSTNIITPGLSVITNIGLDHCDMLGGTLPEIAFEKAGIIKPEVPVVVGESDPLTDPVFERKVLYTNLSSPAYMGDRARIMSLLTFADKVTPSLWDSHAEILRNMDLKGEYQAKNLRTVLAALDVLPSTGVPGASADKTAVKDALERTAAITDFHGRWEKLSDDPYIICDIGHNSHGLKYNFHQLSSMLADGVFSSLIIVYGSVSDKDYESVFPLMPENAVYVFTSASGKRALPAQTLKQKYMDFCSRAGRPSDRIYCAHDVEAAVGMAEDLYRDMVPGSSARPLIYIGGSTYVVAEAVNILRPRR